MAEKKPNNKIKKTRSKDTNSKISKNSKSSMSSMSSANYAQSAKYAASSNPAPSSKKKLGSRKSRAGKRALRAFFYGVLIVAVSIIALYAIIYHLNGFLASKPIFEFVTVGEVEHTIGATALVVRDEVVVGNGSTGSLITRATEGSRVYTGQRIAMVVPSDMESVVGDLRNTQSQISEVQQELINSGHGAGAEVIYREMDSEIKPMVDMMRLDASNGNISDMSSYTASISVLLDQREEMLAAIDFNDERLIVLRSDEASYENQLAMSASLISAPQPGVISYKLDGLEGELNYDTFLSMSSSQIQQYIEGNSGVITSDMTIEAGEPVARIAHNESQYLAVVLEGEEGSINEFATGTTHDLNIASEGIVIEDALVERVEVADDGLLIIFSTTRYVEKLIDIRTVDIEIVITSTEGLRVQTSSLVNPDYDRGMASIYINKNGYVEEVNVIITDYDREYAIVAPMGDLGVPNTQTVIITNPSTVKPGDKLN